MFRLIHGLKNDEVEERREGMRQYRALLSLGDGISGEELASLRDLMAKLGKTAKDAEVDMRAMATLAEKRALADSLPTATKAQDEAVKAHAEHAAKMDRVIKELSARSAQLLLKRSAADKAVMRANQAARAIPEIELDSWELFGLQKPEPATGAFGPMGSGGPHRAA